MKPTHPKYSQAGHAEMYLQRQKIPIPPTGPGTEVNGTVSNRPTSLACTQTLHRIQSTPPSPNTFFNSPAKEAKEQAGVCLSHSTVLTKAHLSWSDSLW